MLYDFDAQPGSGEMSLKEGEILTVTRQDVGDGWWEGSKASGEAGLFPAAYTEVCVPDFFYCDFLQCVGYSKKIPVGDTQKMLDLLVQ